MAHRSRNKYHIGFIFLKSTGLVGALILTLMPFDSIAFGNSTCYVPNEAHTDIYITDDQLAIFESESKMLCLMLCNQNDQCQSISYNSLSMTCVLFLVTFRGIQNVAGTNQIGWTHFVPYTRDCKDLNEEQFISGIYTIYPGNSPGFMAKCEMDVDGGGWTVIQQRVNGSVDFNRNWMGYKTGFGDLSGEFWLGNDKLHALTTSAAYELRIDVSAWNGNSWYAIYTTFSVGDENSQYQLKIGNWRGIGGNSMSWHNGMKFSTMDRDNDISYGHCSVSNGNGGWWYRNCDYANLNGPYGVNAVLDKGIEWDSAMGPSVQMNSTRMMIRPL